MGESFIFTLLIFVLYPGVGLILAMAYIILYISDKNKHKKTVRQFIKPS